jgi:hypothetical protein
MGLLPPNTLSTLRSFAQCRQWHRHQSAAPGAAGANAGVWHPPNSGTIVVDFALFQPFCFAVFIPVGWDFAT